MSLSDSTTVTSESVESTEATDGDTPVAKRPRHSRPSTAAEGSASGSSTDLDERTLARRAVAPAATAV